jgi:hypothetical protein
MSEDTTTVSEVVTTLNEKLENAEVEESDLVDGVRAVVPDSDVGKAFGLIRRQGWESEQQRDPTCDNVTFCIEAEEEEQEGLGALFG